MASGFQIAFLVLAFHFFTVLTARWASPRLSWPVESFELLGQIITFAGAAILLMGIGTLRKYCAQELRRPWPPHCWPELVAVAAAKVALPFATIGVAVLWALAGDAPERLAGAFPYVDPAKGWEWTLSPLGLLRLLLFSWFLGPVIEELVFRGLLYRAWERQWGWKVSTLLTSALFGACHPGFMFSSFLGSIVYVCVLRRTGTLRACIAVHIAYNILVSWPLLGQFILTPPVHEPAGLSRFTLALACLALVAAALPAYLWMSRRDARCAP